MKLQQFQGGLATRLRPQFLQLNQGVIYTNIDNSTGALTPVKKSLATDIEVGAYHTWYDTAQQWVSSDVVRDYVEYSDILYWTDRTTQPQKYDGTTQANLGITAPTKLTSFSTQVIQPVKEVTASAETGAGLPNVETEYAAVNVNSGRFSNALLFSIKETGKVSSGAVAVGAISLQANVFAPTIVKALAKSTSTRNIRIEDPVGFTIGSGGVNIYRKYQGKYRLVGNLATSSSSLLDNVEDISAAAELDTDNLLPLEGVYQYQLTYYNSSDGSESAPGPISAELDISTAGIVTVSGIPVSSDPQVDKKRLYRLGGNLAVPTLVAELANVTTSYVDELRDSELIGTQLSTSSSGPAPTGLKYLVTAYAMLFGAVGTTLRFTPIGQPDQWPPLYFLQFDATITGIAAVSTGLLVYTKFKTFLVTGTGPTSLSQVELSSSQGCKSYESVQTMQGTALWVSEDGICVSSGGLPEVLTKDTLGRISLDVVDSVIHDEVYYLLLADHTMLAFDFGLGKIFKAFDIGNESLVVANGKLYGAYEGVLYELFASTEYESLTYKSPKFIEGTAVEQKTYKNIRIYHNGVIIIKVYIDDNLVATQQRTGEDSSVVKIPQDKQRGNFIQFEITGTGEVTEIEYIAGERHNV